MSKETCRQCVAYYPKTDDYGQCRMYAPQVVVVKDAIKGTWPHVQASESCHEFEPKEKGSNAEKKIRG